MLHQRQIRVTLLLMSEIIPDRLQRLTKNSKIDSLIQVRWHIGMNMLLQLAYRHESYTKEKETTVSVA